jgi:hypothetical protein
MNHEPVWQRRLLCTVLWKIAISVSVSCVPLLAAIKTYTIDEARPAWAMVKMLEKEYGWRITYEDPPLENMGELRDITNSSYKTLHPGGVTLIPRASPITCEWNDSGAATDRRAVLDRLINLHNASGNPGLFRTFYQGSVSHVIAVSFKNKDGAIATRDSVLESRITFPAQDRSVMETVSLIIRLVGDQTNQRVLLAAAPFHMINRRVVVGADNLTARDALLLTFSLLDAEALGRGLQPAKIVWALLYQADEKVYYLNLYPSNRISDRVAGLLVGPK